MSAYERPCDHGSHRDDLALVEAIYDAGTDEARWQPVVTRIADRTNVESVLLFLRTPSPPQRSATTIVLGATHRSPNWLAAPVLEFEESPSDGLGPSTSLLLWPHADRRYNMRTVRRIVPHVHRSIHLSWRIAAREGRETAVSTLFRDLPFAVAIVSEIGSLLHANGAARQFVETRDGFALRRGRLAASIRIDDARWSEAVRRACKHAGEDDAHVMRIGRPSGRTPLTAVVRPLRGRRALVTIHGGETNWAAVESQLARDYGLTPSEMEVVAELVTMGSELPAIGKILSVSYATVRTQLGSVFAKTRVTRQADLLKLVERIRLATISPTI